MDILVEPTKWDHKLTLDKPFRIECYINDSGNHEMRPDIHYALHLGVLLKGRFESVFSNYRHVNRPGDVWFTGPWEPHASKRMGFSDILLCTILPEKIGEIGFVNELNWLLPFIVPVQDRPRDYNDCVRTQVISLANEIKDAAELKTQAGDIICWLKIHELLLTLIYRTDFCKRIDTTRQSDALERILPAVRLVRETKGMTVSIDDAASACNLGKSRFCDLFKKAMGITFGKFATRVRIGMAAAEVKNSNLPLKEIAASWGFFDESHFYRVFRQYFNCSPNKFRIKKP